MKWLMVFMAVHGVSFSDNQCRVLRQVNLAPRECTKHFNTHRSLAANFSGRTPGVAGSAPGTSAPGGSLSGPNHGGPPGGNAGVSGGSPSSPGGPTHGGPGSPGGGAGDIRPGQPAPPLPELPPQKPKVDPAVVAAVIKGVQERARQAVIDRIVFGAKPPPSQPGKPDFGKPPGYSPGPGGMRGEAQPRNSGSGGNGNGGSRR